MFGRQLHGSRENSRIAGCLLAGFALTAGLAACGDTVDTSTNPPYASPRVSSGDAVIARSCEAVKAGKVPNGLANLQVSLVRQGTDLQRISDDLTGAVPGGNFGVDVELVVTNVQDIQARISGSNVCQPVKGQLMARASALKDADAALKATGGGTGAADALQASENALKALTELFGNLTNT
jgi:hypothetical protein